MKTQKQLTTEQIALRDLARHIAHGFVDDIHKKMEQGMYPANLRALVMEEINRDTQR